jgi:diphthamide synthase (EF-2-diphthine--ammonia ligase)
VRDADDVPDLPDVRDIAFGDLFLEDVRAFREQQCAALDWNPHFPLWDESTTTLARAFIASGHRCTLTCVDTTQLPARFAGRAFDHILLDELPPDCDPCGERGEFHTFVWDAPSMSSPMHVTQGEARHTGRFVFTDLHSPSTGFTA